MKFTLRAVQSETDYWNIRNFLREVFELNNRLEHSWHVARLDYWRWHFILNCQLCAPVENVTALLETKNGKLVGVVHAVQHDEIRLHIHPNIRSANLENDMFQYAEQHFTENTVDESCLYVPVFSDDTLRQEILQHRGYQKIQGWSHHWWRDLDLPIPGAPVSHGYVIRSMGAIEEHPARSWASWRAFHADEPDENYDGDWSWYQNIQLMPLYRRDLDIVAVDSSGEIAAFCTISYDDTTRSAVCVLVGTAAEHWRRGLGKTVIFEGMRRLKNLGCTRVFATAYDPPADALYRSVMQNMKVAETWYKEMP